jgi:hypothetical protein
MSSAGVLVLGPGEKGKVLEVVFGEMSLDDFKVIHVLGDDSGSVPGATKLEVVLDHIFQLLLQLDEVCG